MIERRERLRKTWFMAGALLLLLAVAVTWTLSWTSARAPDDPEELLRRARELRNTAIAQPTGKSVEAKGTSSSGAPVQARFLEVKEKGGKSSFVLTLPTPLKEGEDATVKMPGGRQILIERPREGEPTKAVKSFLDAQKSAPR